MKQKSIWRALKNNKQQKYLPEYKVHVGFESDLNYF